MANRSLACALALMGAVVASAQSANEIVLTNFIFAPGGAAPCAGVTRDPAGAIYGTTSYGGTGDSGVVYKLDAGGHETVLHSFAGVAHGGGPCSGVTLDSAGNLYGTTSFGGTDNAGVVYKLDPAGHETLLYNFTGGADGGMPQSGVILDSAGNLYGTASTGGVGNNGVVYKLNASGHETVLYSFRGGTSDGSVPIAGVIRDSNGNLYGTTVYGGTTGWGTVYQLDSSGQETVLYSFDDYECNPGTGVVRDSSGNLYGTAGCGEYRYGVVYKLDAAGHETVLHNFSGGAVFPVAAGSGLIVDAAGNLYGTALLGGTSNAGVVFKLDSAGRYTVLYNFTGGPDGGTPYAGVIGDSDGNLYGTTSNGGTVHLGVVFKLDAVGRESVLYTFKGGKQGAVPEAGLIRDSAGNLYGTTDAGGPANAGVVYKLDTSGRETVLYSFSGGADGASPYTAGVIADPSGNLYGTTQFGGTANQGVVYKLDSSGHETVLYNFTGLADGGYPQATPIRDSAGNLYGTTQTGTVYKLDISGTLTVLYTFPCGSGCSPYPSLILDSAGNLYGTTFMGGTGNVGTVYQLNPSGTLTVLYNFTCGADGAYPYGVIRDAASNLYGTTSGCGGGTVFKLDKPGHLTTLYSFTGGADGGLPEAGVILDSAGNLYGTTAYGGPVNSGAVFKLDPTGQESVLYGFTCGTDGCYPRAGLVRDPAGNLFGTTPYGGKHGTGLNGVGVVFEIKPQ